MTRIPSTFPISPHRLLPVPPQVSPSLVRLRTMTEAAGVPSARIHGRDDTTQTLDLRDFPTPISPPYPALSRDVELSRAMSAASRSALFALTDREIVFEDEWLAVVNKPSGIYCETVLSSYTASLSPDLQELHLANRLDRDTSGLMVITKSHKAAAKLVKAFTEHRVTKTYIALCVGQAPEWGRISIRSGHGRSRFGAWRVYSASDVGRILPGGSSVKHMATSFEVLSIVNGDGGLKELGSDVGVGVGVASSTLVVDREERRRDNIREETNGNDEILVRVSPQTGRTHQIRLHCQYLGMPIRGDVKYGGVHQWRGTTWDAHALHAETLSFDHPVTGVPVQLRSPLPSWASDAACPGNVTG